MAPVHSPLRWYAAALLLGNALVHVPLIPEHLEEARYVGLLFIALSVVATVLALMLVVADSVWAWGATAAVSVLSVAAFLVSRTVGLPQLQDDIGNWSEPLGFPALLVETVAALVAGAVLLHRSSPHQLLRKDHR